MGLISSMSVRLAHCEKKALHVARVLDLELRREPVDFALGSAKASQIKARRKVEVSLISIS